MSKDINTCIGYFIDVNFDRGGAPISTKLLVEGVASSTTAQCTIIKPYSENEVENKEFSIIHLQSFTDKVPFFLLHPIKWIRLCMDIKSIIQKNDFKIIHAQMPNVGLAIGLIKMLHLISADTKLIYTDREHVAYMRLFERLIFILLIGKRYDGIVTLSEKSFQYWSKVVRRARVKKIYNSAVPQFELIEKDSDKYNDEKLTLIYVGRMVVDKNWPLSIEIIKSLPECNHIVIMSYFDHSQKEEAENMLEEIRNRENVHILFNLNTEEIKKEYQKANILVMTSRRESFGRTAVEAMAQKCVVIGTDVGGLPEVIGKKENVLKSNAELFVQRIKSYNEDRAQLSNDMLFFFNRYRTNFSYQSNIDGNIELYRDILQGQ